MRMTIDRPERHEVFLPIMVGSVKSKIKGLWLRMTCASVRVPLLTYGGYEHPQNVCLLVTISSFASSSDYEDTYGYS